MIQILIRLLMIPILILAGFGVYYSDPFVLLVVTVLSLAPLVSEIIHFKK